MRAHMCALSGEGGGGVGPTSAHAAAAWQPAFGGCQAAAHRLEARFVETGRPLPALVSWTQSGVEAWLGAGAGSAGRLHGLGRLRGEDASVRALGLFGLGEDELEGRRVPMVALAMQARSGESVLWLRRFERPKNGRARWLDPVGLIRSPITQKGSSKPIVTVFVLLSMTVRVIGGVLWLRGARAPGQDR